MTLHCEEQVEQAEHGHLANDCILHVTKGISLPTNTLL